MSHSKPLAPVISPTLHDRPRTNLVPWKVAINRAARAVFAEWDDFGFLFGVCDDAVWAVLNTPPGGMLRDRPEFPAPAALGANANPAARDVFKRATDSRSAWLACSASFCAAILESIGDANRLAIADPNTDTLHLSPRDIIIAMTVLHGEMTGAEVDALRVPLKKKLTAISDLPGHIVAFRGSLGRLATVGQAPLPLDVYRWFLATLSPFPVFQQYTLLFTVANGAIAQQTFEAYAAYVLPQLHNILAHSNPRPFAGNLEGLEYGADEDMMTGDLLYPNPLYPTINSAQHLYPPPPLYPTQQHLYPPPGAYPTPQPYLPPPPGLGFAPHPHYPMANAMYQYPPTVAPSPAPASSDKAGTRQKGKNKKGSKTAPKEKTGTLNTTLPRTSLLRPSKTHFYCHHHGWVTTHARVAIWTWWTPWRSLYVHGVPPI